MKMSNTATRILVSIIAIPAIVLACYFGKYYFFVFVLFIGLMSYYEFWAFARKKSANANLVIGLIAVGFIILNVYKNLIEFYLLFVILLLLLTLIELFNNDGSAILNLGVTFWGILYFGLFSSALILLREFYFLDYIRGGLLIIAILAGIWICDSAAFFVGTALGKHKLFPRVSPNKSWEGAAFGLLFAILTMIVSKFLILDFLTWMDIVVIGLIVGVIGQIGDLIESLLKRDAGIKDSSKLIPGHGGVFDRFDSLLYTAPAVYIYLKYLT